MEIRNGKYGFAYSAICNRTTYRGRDFQHSLGFTSASSEEEAYGLALRYQQKMFPSSQGWNGYNAVVSRIDNITYIDRLDIGR